MNFDLATCWHGLAYLHQCPTGSGQLKKQPEDFFVDEVMGFEPSGEGEHLWLQVRKRDANTADVIKSLSGRLGVSPKVIGHSGLKDRWAVTQQWLSVQLPGQDAPDMLGELSPGVEVIAQTRHHKKLRPGTHAANCFEIRLRELTQPEECVERLENIIETGVPNYFGEQRFGREGKNLSLAQSLFAGKRIKSRNQKSMAISSARSFLFNRVASERVAQGLKPLDGESLMLSGSRSFFTAEQIDGEISERLANADVLLSAPLWGRGELPSIGSAGEIERASLVGCESLMEGLEGQGLKQERRPLILRPESLSWQVEGNEILLKFSLPTGSFATAVVRELIQIQENT
ncbi:tRNA pseudouridine(13) synthase TruD [Corallincola platygyrae]|uniref:tRNA pseudouridine synthase D n=1 Tax=Corallincola platygyrae TaxID=1193278 RepID=A0ABW4XLN8_9GAMM